MITPQTLKGFRDFLPEDAMKRQYVIDIIRKTFELYGFGPLETPALEYEEVLLGKYGEEGDKLMYRFEDNGKRKVALRYDQTVPLARVVAQYQNELPFPFKRYQIQPVWRAENTQKGRYREFLQCDIDTVGSSSINSDAEIIACVLKIIKSLGFKDYVMKINDKNELDKRLELIGVPSDKYVMVTREIDKKDKKDLSEIDQTLYNSFGSLSSLPTIVTASGTATFITDLKSDKTVNTISQWLNEPPKEIAKTLETAANQPNFKEFFELTDPDKSPFFKSLKEQLKKMDVNDNELEFDRTLVRGLSYYTGSIFELKLKGDQSGSLGGGGRYDNLIGMFSETNIPAVGFAFGFDRTIEAMNTLNLFPADLTTVKVLITIFSPELQNLSLELSSQLRSKNINAEMYLDENDKLDKQLKYADKKGIPFVAIIGPEEVKENTVTLKNLKTKEQKTISISDLPNVLKSA